jgi:protocatechuate 3,4-dioxygenase, beta subunit
MRHDLDRRRFIQRGIALASVTGAAGVASVASLQRAWANAPVLVPTPPVSEGPFYPRMIPADADNDLTRIRTSAASAASAARGTPLEVVGRLLNTRGEPIAGATIEIWQCDDSGTYHHVGYDSPNMDRGFQGFGATKTDADGRYRFRTIKPAAYPGRTPHIHYIVKPASGRGITSQMFVEGEPGNERDFLFRGVRDPKQRERLVMKLSGTTSLTGALDIVLRT